MPVLLNSLAEQLRNHPRPIVLEHMPKGMGPARLFRHLRAKGFQAERALILTTVSKVVFMAGPQADTEDVPALPKAAMVVTFNTNLYILMGALLPRTPVQSRKLFVNTCAHRSAASAFPQSKSIGN